LPLDCPNAAPYRIAATHVGIVDHLDGILQIRSDADDGTLDGKVTLTINRDPVYIHYNP
jgi:hypothetical protein